MSRPYDFAQPQGERIVRLETVLEHLEEHTRTNRDRIEQHSQTIGRLATRMDRQEAQTSDFKAALAKLEDLPRRISDQEKRAEDRKREKEERKAMRHEALALVKWAVTFLLIAATALGYVPESTFKTLASAFGLGK